MMKRLSSTLFVCALGLTAACADDEPDVSRAAPAVQGGGSGGTAGASGEMDAPDDGIPAGCQRGTLEPDLNTSPFSGAGVADGKIAAGEYVISSTYLRLKAGQQDRFETLLDPIMADLGARDGLVAISLGGSPKCGTARTLAVWRDDVAMFAFVTGEAHSAAVRAVGEVSRGGSVVTHWSGDQDSASWKSAAEHLAADDGPQY